MLICGIHFKHIKMTMIRFEVYLNKVGFYIDSPTKTGAEHICKKFLEVKSGVITFVNLRDFKKYDNIYILNPIEGELNYEGIENRSLKKESDEYLFMLGNIPRPQNIAVLFKTENI